MDIGATLSERGGRYGDFTYHAELAQEIQDIMRGFRKVGEDRTVVNPWAKLSPVQKQALTVIADKIARILSGDPNYTDNWHDIQGYAKLAEERCVDTSLPQFDFLSLALHSAARHAALSKHRACRSEDGYFCPDCAKHWSFDEGPPDKCV